MFHSLFLLSTASSLLLSSVKADTSFQDVVTSYPNVFVDPNFLLNKNGWNPGTGAAQTAVTGGANWLAAQGPWAVTNKTILPPSNNTHDYLSYAPYYWADCSNVHNTTLLTQQQINNECNFVDRDGQFTPDQHAVNNTGDFIAMSDAVLYSSIAWVITGNDLYAQDVNNWIYTWFVNNATIQTPNLNYAQLVRGVGKNIGTHTGLLDFKVFSKIATGVLVLRLGKAKGYTTQVDNGLKAWVQSYLPWILNNTLAVQERESGNNHGSYYFNQLASLYLLMDDKANALATVKEYFSGIYQNQINANGEQPLEAVRADPIHYRAYNLCAVITNARIAQYLGYNAWNLTTKAGGTIQKATDYAIVQNPNPTNELGAVPQYYQIVAAMATVFGDPNGTYKKYLSSVSPSEPFFLWDFDATINSTSTTTASIGAPTGGSSKHQSAGSLSSSTSVLSLTTISLAGVAVALSSLL